MTVRPRPKHAHTTRADEQTLKGETLRKLCKQVRFCTLNVGGLIPKLTEIEFVNFNKSVDMFSAVETFTSSTFDFTGHFG